MFLSEKRDSHLLLLCALLSMLILVVDLSIPLGVAGGVPYVMVVLLALRASNNRYALLFAGIGSLLTLVGLFFSDVGGVYWMVLTNRALALFAIWVTALLGLQLKRLQASLLESEGRFQFMADEAPVMIWGAGPEGNWNFFSKGWLDFTGRSLPHEQGSGWQKGVHPSDRESVDQAYRQALKNRQPFQVESRLLCVGGSYRWVVIQGAPRFLEDGRFAGFIGTGVDVSDLKEAELKLEEAMQKYFHREKMASIGTLAAGILHEIGNPVASISGLTQELMDDEHLGHDDRNPQAKKYQSHLEIIHQELNRLTRITQDVSQFASISSAELELQNLNGLIERTCRLMRHDERMLNVTLEVQLDRSIPAVRLVADHFIQLLMNLLGNAVDACRDNKEDARILIHTWVDRGGVMMEVKDNGCGMSSKTLARAGEPFFTTKPAGEGMGLGLSLCHTLIEENQGKLKIKSSVGEGTSAFVCFSSSGDNS